MLEAERHVKIKLFDLVCVELLSCDFTYGNDDSSRTE
jgi:hypothetical protein